MSTYMAAAIAVAALYGVVNGATWHFSKPRTVFHDDGTWSLRTEWVVRAIFLTLLFVIEGALLLQVAQTFTELIVPLIMTTGAEEAAAIPARIIMRRRAWRRSLANVKQNPPEMPPPIK